MKYIDMHGHYAWGIDDGMSSKEEAYKALSIAKSNGIAVIVATPHVVCGKHSNNDIMLFKNRIKELRKLANTLDIIVVEGCELFLNDLLIEHLSSGNFIPIQGTNYLLCEIDVRKDVGSTDEFEDLYYEVVMKGYTPIVAHVERYFKEEIDIERVKSLIRMGCVIQVNSTSILSSPKRQSHKNAMTLLDNNLVHIIATDTHSAKGERIPNLKYTYETLLNHYDKENLKLLFFKNQLAILENKKVKNTAFEKVNFFDKLFNRRK